MRRAVWDGIRRLGRQIGRRGASLLFVGLLALVIAASLVLASPEQRATPGYAMLASVAPISAWAGAWAVSGALSLVQAFMRSDRVAFAMATALMLLYGLIYLVSTFSGINPRGWVGGAIWLAFGGWIALIATWPEAIYMQEGGDLDTNWAVITAASDGNILSFNQAASRMFGWSEGETIGRPLAMLMPERFRERHAAGLAQARRGKSKLSGRAISLAGLHRDGREFPIELMINSWQGADGLTFTGIIQAKPEAG